MRHDQHGSPVSAVDLLKEDKDLLCGSGIQRSRGFVTEQKGRVLNQRPGNGAPLLLSTGELRRKFVLVLHKTQNLQQFPGFKRFRRKITADLYIFPDSQVGDQVVELKDESQRLPSVVGQFLRFHPGDLLSADTDPSAVCRFQSSDHIQKCRFSGTGWTEDDADLTFFNLRADAVQHMHQRSALSVTLSDLFHFNIHICPSL